MKPKLFKQQRTLIIFGINKAGKQIFFSDFVTIGCVKYHETLELREQGLQKFISLQRLTDSPDIILTRGQLLP